MCVCVCVCVCLSDVPLSAFICQFVCLDWRNKDIYIYGGGWIQGTVKLGGALQDPTNGKGHFEAESSDPLKSIVKHNMSPLCVCLLSTIASQAITAELAWIRVIMYYMGDEH